jgi:hypothetical protein
VLTASTCKERLSRANKDEHWIQKPQRRLLQLCITAIIGQGVAEMTWCATRKPHCGGVYVGYYSPRQQVPGQAFHMKGCLSNISSTNLIYPVSGHWLAPVCTLAIGVTPMQPDRQLQRLLAHFGPLALRTRTLERTAKR